MRNPINFFRRIKSHYNLFGAEGIRFLYRIKTKKESVIEIKVPGYAQPVYLRNSTADLPMFYYIFQANDFDFDSGSTPEVIIDCGAHIGLTAVFFANKYPTAKIFCIEPEKSNFELLKKNTRSYPNIECLQYGIWNKTTNLKIVDTMSGNWGFRTDETDKPGEDTIPAISMDEIMRRYNLDKIDICKINVEGTEKELFEKNYSKWLSRTKLIFIELHDHLKEGCAKSFFKALADYNFALSPKGFYLLIRMLAQDTPGDNVSLSVSSMKSH